MGANDSYFNFSLFDNIPYRRIKKSVFKLGGLKTKYLRFYSVLPNMKKRVLWTYAKSWKISVRDIITGTLSKNKH